MQTAARAYLQTQVQTTSQGKLLLMLYDGCIKFLNQAKDKIEEKDYAQKGILISKALDVINELDSSLNAEKGGDLAENLHKLYFYCSTRLLNANLKMDISYIDEVIKILTGLRGAYAQIIDTPEAQAAMAQTIPMQTGQTHVPRGTMRPASMKAPQFGTPIHTPSAPASIQPSSTATGTQQKSGVAPVTTNGTAQTDSPMPQAQPAAPASPQATPLSFAGKRVSGAAMYKKMASQTTP